MIMAGKVKESYFKVVIEEPFRRKPVKPDLNNEGGPAMASPGEECEEHPGKPKGNAGHVQRIGRRVTWQLGCKSKEVQEMKSYR